MGRFKLQGKIKGLVEVLFSHFAVLFITMLISFILPLRISVAEYGKWQLFSLIVGYAGFFALGFNDGIHVNYSGLDYDGNFFPKFITFRKFIDALSIVSTALVLIVVLCFNFLLEDKFFLYVFAAFNIIPVLVNGFFTYVNQGTMRFNYYATAQLLEKIIYLFVMIALLLFGVQNALYYVLAYTLARYAIIVYNRITSKELYGKKGISIKNLTPEIKGNFKTGFVLMIATILNQSIIVPSRLLVEGAYGIVAFGCYSFAIHTMVVANQVSTSMSQVFYPAMKKSEPKDFMSFFNTLDNFVGLLSILLLLSYYPICILVSYLYPGYLEILDYLYCLYPMFIYTSKSLILIINTYKMDKDDKKLLVNNLLGVILNAIAVFFAHFVFHSVKYIALFSLLAYIVWYYICYLKLIWERKEKAHLFNFLDLLAVGLFVAINVMSAFLKISYIQSVFVSAGGYLLVCLILFLLFKNKCLESIKSFVRYMNK